MYNNLQLCKHLYLDMLIITNNKKWGITKLVFELLALKTKIKGVFDQLYHWYGNQKCHENQCNLLANDWAFVLYHYWGSNW